ncbi:hypothetical protein [Halochromatium roseum]|uniref:hypothetical protein n=1 Tax=Halochromatium roseum TaxID=391920 RepID=UPI001912DAC9|nr:hypothetical protein [Halochromatium roseum]
MKAAEAPPYREPASLRQWIKPGRWETLRFALPSAALSRPQPLRLDPANRACRLRIRALRLGAAESNMTWWSAEAGQPSAQAFARLRLQGDG